MPEIVIDVDNQEMTLMQAGQEVAKFPVSTSKFGLGDEFRSYKTPVGVFEVCDKTGGTLPLGAVLKKGQPTGEVLQPDAPGRDPIVTRMIRLRGLESQNRHALERGIFIHGTPEERRLGKPVSWGCIRMRSKDVVTLYSVVPVGTRVVIKGTGHTGGLFHWLAKVF
ncbi:MAG: L,D-transpeptidase [Chthoniobacteraceae bacterium]|nr:L,D-transpeptidase [Chthoniobacteraceae bacterium]